MARARILRSAPRRAGFSFDRGRFPPSVYIMGLFLRSGGLIFPDKIVRYPRRSFLVAKTRVINFSVLYGRRGSNFFKAPAIKLNSTEKERPPPLVSSVRRRTFAISPMYVRILQCKPQRGRPVVSYVRGARAGCASITRRTI